MAKVKAGQPNVRSLFLPFFIFSKREENEIVVTVKKIITIFMVLLMFTINASAEGSKDITFKVQADGENIAVTEDEITSDIDNSDLQVKAVRYINNQETVIYSGALGEYDNGAWIHTDFSEIEFLVILDWETPENEAIYVIPIDYYESMESASLMTQPMENGKTLVYQASMITTTVDNAEIDVSLLYNNSYSESVLLPGEELTAEFNVNNNRLEDEISLSTIIALYDSAGRLLDMNTESLTIDANSNDAFNNSIVVPAESSVNTAKIMVWESMNSLKPYAEPVILTLTGNDFFGDDYTVSQSINGKNKAGGKINGINDTDVFSFVPQNDGLYYFESFSDIDTYASLYNGSNLTTPIVSDDNSGVENNFRLTATLNANTTYYLYMNGRAEGSYTVNYGYSIGNIFGTVNPVKFYDDDTEFNSIVEATVDLKTYYSEEFVATMHLKDWSESDSEYASYSMTGVHSGEYIAETKRPGYLTYYKKISLTDNAVDLGSVTLIPGDVNGDNVVNSADATIISNLLGTEYGNENYSVFADINGDKIINSADLSLVNANLNKNSNEYTGTANVILLDTEINDSQLIISGNALPNSIISCDVFYDGYSIFESETTCTASGAFEFVTELNRNGTYNISVSSTNQAYEANDIIEY